MAGCPNCEESNPARARFCLNCGQPIAPAQGAGTETRKTVTVLFADLCGSTTLGELLDPESFSRVMASYYEATSGVLERHGATVQKFIGDAVMAVFGIPVIREDDALRAVRAAADLGPGLVKLNGELRRDWGVGLRVRIGINTGEVVAGSPRMGSALVVGDAVNVASRLEQAAGPDEVLLGQSTWHLVRDAVDVERLPPLTLKGKQAGVAAYRLREVRAGSLGHARRSDAPMVGRLHEQALIASVYQRMVRGGGSQLVTVLGPAGVGKSRLVAEALGPYELEATVLLGRCLSYGEGITFWPVAEIVRQAAGIGDADDTERAQARIRTLLDGTNHGDSIAERLAQLVGLTASPPPAEEVAWTVRTLLERLTRQRPVVVVLDDLHWAEPTLLDLVDHLVDRSRDTPLLLVAAARPELLEQRPSWGGGKVNVVSMLLEPLDQAEADQLLGQLLPTGMIGGAARERITEAAGGNPLFLEELLAMLIEEGQITEHDGAWLLTDDQLEVAIPPTIQALLGARLDHLDAELRAVLERASIIGHVFEQAAVEELAGPELRPATPAALAALVHKGLLAMRGGQPSPAVFQFRHLLFRDAVYTSVPKKVRAELHEQFAEWLARGAPDRARDGEELIGYHLEQAYHTSAALHPVADRERRLGARAAERLAAAGQRSLDAGDMAAAAGLLSRATALLAEDDSARVVLLPDLGRALMERGELDQAETVIEAAIEGAAAVGDRRTGAYALLERIRLRATLKPEGWAEEARREARNLMPLFEELADDRGLARAWGLLGATLRHWCQLESSEEASQRAVVLARRAGDEQEAAANLGVYLLANLDGPVPAGEAVRRCEQVLATSGGRRRVEGQVQFILAGLRAMQGDFDEARRLLARSASILEELGTRLLAAELSRVHGEIELLADDPAAAERELRRGHETLGRMAEGTNRSLLAALLARAMLAQGRGDEAGRLLEETAGQIATDDFAARIAWGAARSRLLAEQDRVEEAETLGGMVVELARDTDAVGLHAVALLDLATVLARAGRPEEAAALADQARALAEGKGNVVLAGRAQRLLIGLTGTPTVSG
jgi:class 3 adenylate cyclase/tetratricopeptide (TPR) repeat protein